LQPLRELSLAIPVETAYWQGSKNKPMKLEWTSVLSDRLFLDVQAAYWYNAFPLFPTATKSSSVEGVPVGRIDLATSQQSGANNAYQDQVRHKPQFSGSLSYFKDNWAGNHSFKFGVEWQKDRKQFGSFQPGDVYYRDRGGVTEAVDIWNTPNTSINDAVGTHFYAQDSWTINRRVTLNLGARGDKYDLGWPDQEFTPNQRGFFDPVSVSATDVVSLKSISPRIGLAWDLNGKGKTVLKAFVGRFYYNQKPALLRWALTKPLDRVVYSQLAPRKADFDLVRDLMIETGVLKKKIEFSEKRKKMYGTVLGWGHI